MVLHIIEATASKFFPTRYTIHIAVFLLTVLILRSFSQGRKTSRERDLHARTILVTGGFSPFGITLLHDLAKRGAHIIALTPDPIDSPQVTILISLLRETTSNNEVYAEQCDLSSPSSIRAFCMGFLKAEDQRLDAILFAHEYQHIGSLKMFRRGKGGVEAEDEENAKAREAGTLATFLIITLLLPVLLVAPAERDIRIINVINPFYAAAAGPSFSVSSHTRNSQQPQAKRKSIFLLEGTRSLRNIIFTRHLQRILDALPIAAQVPKTEDGSSAIPVVSPKLQKSNIVSVSVSPGISRVDTVAALLNANWTVGSGSSYFGIFVYTLLQPFLRIFTKTPNSAIQSVLHVLFLPTPFKVLAQTTFKTTSKTTTSPNNDPKSLEMPEEVLKPGALYAECAVVNLAVPSPPEESGKDKDAGEKGKGKEQETMNLPDDGEYGGELAGRLVWEACEEALKLWEKENPNPVAEDNAKPQDAGK